MFINKNPHVLKKLILRVSTYDLLLLTGIVKGLKIILAFREPFISLFSENCLTV